MKVKTTLGEASVTLADRCEKCERWARVKNAPSQGVCGKRGWRTDKDDWCRYYRHPESSRD
jgi:hypothetical protein